MSGKQDDHDRFRKMHIALKVDRHGWPPAGVESLWVEHLDRNRYRVDNTPFFAKGFAAGDVVRAKDRRGWLQYKKRLQSGGNSVVRIIVLPDGSLHGDIDAAIEFIKPFGVGYEGLPEYSLIALDIEPHADMAALKRVLREKEANGTWEWEEACVTKEWKRA